MIINNHNIFSQKVKENEKQTLQNVQNFVREEHINMLKAVDFPPCTKHRLGDEKPIFVTH